MAILILIVHFPFSLSLFSLYILPLYFSLLPTSPPLLRDRLDVFYVQPDSACSTDGPLWFSSTPLERRILESLLTRVLLVRDIYTDKQHLEEDEEEEDRVEAVGGE